MQLISALPQIALQACASMPLGDESISLQERLTQTQHEKQQLQSQLAATLASNITFEQQLTSARSTARSLNTSHRAEVQVRRSTHTGCVGRMLSTTLARAEPARLPLLLLLRSALDCRQCAAEPAAEQVQPGASGQCSCTLSEAAAMSISSDARRLVLAYGCALSASSDRRNRCATPSKLCAPLQSRSCRSSETRPWSAVRIHLHA